MFKLNSCYVVQLKESSLLKTHVILIEISNMWTTIWLLQCWVRTFKVKISW